MSQAAKENSLDLSNNSIGDDGAKALAEMLEVNTSLKCLILSKNSIRYNGAKALTKMYNDSTSLVWLILFDNPIGDKGKIALEIMTRMTLKRLVDDPDPIVSKNAEALAKTLKSLVDPKPMVSKPMVSKKEALAQTLSKFKKVNRSITRSVEKSHRRKNKSKTKSGPKRSSNRKNY